VKSIQAIARALTERFHLKRWVCPHVAANVRFDGKQIFVSMSRGIPVPALQAQVLRHCTGTKTTLEIIQELLADTQSGFQTAEEVEAILEKLLQLRRIDWEIIISNECQYPEKWLWNWLANIPDSDVRTAACAELTIFLKHQNAIAATRGNPTELQQAMMALNADFQTLTEQLPTQRGGEVYAGRTIVYEDTRRNTELTLSTKLLDDLNDSLTPLLYSSRWIAAQVANKFRQVFRTKYAELCQKYQTSQIPYMTFATWITPVIFDDPEGIADILADFQQRWKQLLPIDYEYHQYHVSSQDIVAESKKLFAAACPGWKHAMYNSPDLLLAARDSNAINQGDFFWILGEMHIALNTIDAVSFMSTFPDTSLLQEAINVDFPQPRITNIASHEYGFPKRTHPYLMLEKDYRIMTHQYHYDVAPAQPVPASTLTVQMIENELRVTSSDGRINRECIEFWGESFSTRVVSSFQIFPTQAHQPRVTIDRLVITRETWRFPSDEIDFALANTSVDRLLATRRWIKRHNIPRYVFVKTPLERKPFFVDWTSSILIDHCAKAIRQCIEQKNEQPIQISEMLPLPQDCWLTDANNQHYTSELRWIIVDQSC
jgi:hypothetical protein